MTEHPAPSAPALYGVAIFHGIGDVLNCTPLARQLKSDDPECRITWFSSERHGFVLDNNPDIDELVLFPGDPFALDARIQELASSRPWTRFFTPAPYLNYEKRPGASLHELIRASTGLDYSVPFWPVLRLREEERSAARSYWATLPHGPRILIETEFHSDQSHWTDACAFDVFEALKGLDPLLVFSGRARPPYLEDLEARGARTAFCPAPLRQVAELYNLADAFIGVSSGLSCISLSTCCRRDLPSIEYCRGEHWSTAHWDHPQERTYAYTHQRFLDALDALAARLSGTEPAPDFSSRGGRLQLLEDGRERIACPGCGADRATPVRRHDVVSCRACGLVYLRTRRPEDETAAYYESVYGIGTPDAAAAIRTPKDRAEAESAPSNIAAGRPDHLAWLLDQTGLEPGNTRALDIGCGWGAWLLGCRAQGMSATGVELSSANVAFAQEHLRLDVRQGQFPALDIPGESQDLVTFFHSLEHVSDPSAFLSKAAHALAPGGWLYVVVPNFESFASTVLGDAWPWIEPAWHQVHFTRRSLLDLVFQAGFQLEHISTAAGDYGTEGLAALLKSQSPEASDQAVALAIEQLGRNGVGEELRLLARKRGGFKGRIAVRPNRGVEGICALDGRTPLANALKRMFEQAPPRAILHASPSGFCATSALLAGLVRRHRLPEGSLIRVEDISRGGQPDTRGLERAGLSPWIDAWLAGISLPEESSGGPECPEGDARKDDLLREGLKRLGYRPGLVVLSGEGGMLLRQLARVLELAEAPCEVFLQSDPSALEHLRSAMAGDPRLGRWVSGDGFLAVRFTPGQTPPKPVVERILWVRTDAIGDAVLSASMLPWISQAYPGAEITVLCQEHVAPLYEACPHVSRCLTFSRADLAKGPDRLEALVRQVGALHADLCLCSIYSREPLSDLMVSASGAWRKIAMDGDTANITEQKKTANNRVFTTLVEGLPEGCELDRHAHFLRALGIEAGPLRPTVWIDEADEAFAESLFNTHGLDPHRTLALFAGAQSPHRIYPGYGRALSEALAGEDWTVVALGTHADRTTHASTLAGYTGPILDLCGKATLRQTAAVLKRCRLAVGAETGLAHIACAVETPQVVVLGGGHFGRFMPSSPLTTAAVNPLSCFLCDWRCPYSRAYCVKDLHPSVVAEAIRQTLQTTARKPRLFAQSDRSGEPEGPAPLDLAPILNAGEVELTVVDPGPPRIDGASGEPRLTVFCGVWHKDPNRQALLMGHEACLKAQSIPVRRLYVFDGGDLPPAWLESEFLVSSRPLDLYEAWDLAVQHVRTPFLMNLNLDDRLCRDAAERYVAALEAGADLVGGDWRICFSQEATDAAAMCEPARACPFIDAWPPLPNRPTRLGSGTGERGTYGPATAWRSSLHQKLPHYPWRFKDGSPVRTIGDAIWWELLQKLGCRLERLPWIVGHYHSHPADQAEFRDPARGEHEKFAAVGVRIL